ncbi:hypothetical protein D3C74_312690 [compost metagenome]
MRIVDNLLDDMQYMSLHPLYRRPIVYIGVISEHDAEKLIGHHNQVQIIVRLLDNLYIRNFKSGRTNFTQLLNLLLYRIILKYHNVVNQVLFLLGQCLNFIQREAVIGSRGQCLFLRFPHHFHKSGIPFTLNPNRDGINEQTDHMLYTSNIRRTSRYDTAEYNILIVVIFLQNKAPHALHQRINRDLLLLCNPVYGFAPRWVQIYRYFFRNIFTGNSGWNMFLFFFLAVRRWLLP